jgi:hypothetical protein
MSQQFDKSIKAEHREPFFEVNQVVIEFDGGATFRLDEEGVDQLLHALPYDHPLAQRIREARRRRHPGILI